MQKLTLAELKRRLAIGTRVALVRVGNSTEGRGIGARTVCHLQSNAVAFYRDDDARTPPEKTWLFWPKASEVEGTSEGFLIHVPEANYSIEYRWL